EGDALRRFFSAIVLAGDRVTCNPRTDRRLSRELKDQRVADDREGANVLEWRSLATLDPRASGIGALEVHETKAAPAVESAAWLRAEGAVVVPVAAEDVAGAAAGDAAGKGDGKHERIPECHVVENTPRSRLVPERGERAEARPSERLAI